MAGTLVPFLPMTPFDFSFLANGTTKTIVLHPALNVTGYYRGRLIMRVHEIDMNGSGSPYIEIGALGTLPCSTDPREYTLSTTSTLVVTTAGASVGDLVADTDTDLFPFLKMYVKGVQGGTAGARVFAVLSADLLLREA